MFSSVVTISRLQDFSVGIILNEIGDTGFWSPYLGGYSCDINNKLSWKPYKSLGIIKLLILAQAVSPSI